MTDEERIALEHQNWIAYLTGVLGCTRHAEVTRTGGVVTILTGLPMDCFNQVLIEREAATATGVLAGVAQARERGRHFVVRLRDDIEDRFIATLTEAGLVPAGRESSTPRVVADGVVAGCDVAALQASQMGRPIYERLGFRTVVTCAAYVDPALTA